MNKKALLVLVVLTIIGITFYTYLGGFTKPTVTIATSKTMYVAGVPFEGSMKDEKLQNAFKMSADVLQKGSLKGTLGNIYYNDPEKSGDSLRAFIGIIIPDSTAKLPNGYTLRTVPGGRKVIHAEANANLALLPRKLYTAAFDYAKEEKLKMEEFYVEWFPEEDQGVLEVLVKQ
ncbi:GyrI-like domain-containing protein [Pontibacter ruber]|uniref:GyrI-like domain-containing protein n=1 Tax=Pontibacter ruber TaxID=1343895 RepID=A0ABW5CVY7_9BACT|nr:GyrI-like domain-containing protein [Pontibacter ruber]